MAKSHRARHEEIGCELAAEVLCTSGRLTLRAFGTSMLPAVWPGDILTIHRAEFGKLEPGELVLVARDRGFVIHRMVSRDSGVLITRGDALAANDAPVYAGQVLGRVVSIRRGNTEKAPGRAPKGTERLLGFLVRRSDVARDLALRLNALRFRLRTWRKEEKPVWM